MMTQKSKQTPEQMLDADLNAFFDAAKDADVVPSTTFMDRVMADAAMETQARVPPVVRPKPQPWWASVLDSFGGWQTVGALTACACFGIYLGYANPETVDYINGAETTAEIFETDSFSVAYDIEALFQEG